MTIKIVPNGANLANARVLDAETGACLLADKRVVALNGSKAILVERNQLGGWDAPGAAIDVEVQAEVAADKYHHPTYPDLAIPDNEPELPLPAPKKGK